MPNRSRLCPNPPSLQVHKIILSARSRVFDRLLNGNMREGSEGRVVIHDIKAPVFRALLQVRPRSVYRNCTFLQTGHAEPRLAATLAGPWGVCGTVQCNLRGGICAADRIAPTTVCYSVS